MLVNEDEITPMTNFTTTLDSTTPRHVPSSNVTLEDCGGTLTKEYEETWWLVAYICEIFDPL